MKVFPALYKKSTKGKPQQWHIYAEKNSDNTASYTTEHGYIDGSIQRTTVRVEQGKNIGKSNETSPYEQACSEAESKWKAKLDKGYVENLKDFDSSLKPMLAHNYDDHQKKVKWPCIVQPKLDGCRCLAFWVENEVVLLSRQGKEFTSMSHIKNSLEATLPKDLILDGELYCHKGTFPERMSWIKKEQANSMEIDLVVYDVLDSSLPYIDRFAQFQDWLVKRKPTYIKEIESKKIYNHEELIEIHAEFVAKGYEGVILRNADCMYKPGGRSQQLLKFKAFKDGEYEIIGAEENKGKQEGQCTFILLTPDGQEFRCKPKGDEELRQWYWDNAQSLVGKFMTVKYFELSEDGVPRFPVGLKVKDVDLE